MEGGNIFAYIRGTKPHYRLVYDGGCPSCGAMVHLGDGDEPAAEDMEKVRNADATLSNVVEEVKRQLQSIR